MVKDYQDGLYYVGAWYDSEHWHKTLCKAMVLDDFGNLVNI